MKKDIVLGAALALAVILPQALCAADAPVLPPGFVIPTGTKDISKAIAGNYVLDTNHVAVLARVSHIGFSISVFRFDKATAQLFWDPKNVSKSKVTATVDTGSLVTNVLGFAAQLTGAEYLNASKFPQATFVSTAFHQTDAEHGTVDGTFTLKGKSIPLTFQVTLTGAGPGFAGSMEMAFSNNTRYICNSGKFIFETQTNIYR